MWVGAGLKTPFVSCVQEDTAGPDSPRPAAGGALSFSATPPGAVLTPSGPLGVLGLASAARGAGGCKGAILGLAVCLTSCGQSGGLSLQDQRGLGFWGDEAGFMTLSLKRALRFVWYKSVLFKGASTDTEAAGWNWEVFFFVGGGGERWKAARFTFTWGVQWDRSGVRWVGYVCAPVCNGEKGF